jgi:hypothetical protein
MVAPGDAQPDSRIHPNDAMRAHPRDADSDRVGANDGAAAWSKPAHYEISVRGPIGPTMMQAFPTLAANRSGQNTMLTGSLKDQSALYGVIHQLEALGLQLLEIRRLPTDDPRTTCR